MRVESGVIDSIFTPLGRIKINTDDNQACHEGLEIQKPGLGGFQDEVFDF